VNNGSQALGNAPLRPAGRWADSFCPAFCPLIVQGKSVPWDYTGAIGYIGTEAAMNRTQWMEDFQKNMSELIAKSPAADIERNVRSMMTQAFTRLDLVTREEFDVQADLLARARTKVDQLSEQLRQLQSRLDAIEAGKTTTE
jgi:BMFP domain-containing protein YqiC